MLVALDWLLLIKPLLNAKLVVSLNLLGIFTKWTLLSKPIDLSKVEIGSNRL